MSQSSLKWKSTLTEFFPNATWLPKVSQSSLKWKSTLTNRFARYFRRHNCRSPRSNGRALQLCMVKQRRYIADVAVLAQMEEHSNYRHTTVRPMRSMSQSSLKWKSTLTIMVTTDLWIQRCRSPRSNGRAL